MISKEELSRSLGTMLTFSTVSCFPVILITGGSHGHAAGIFPFLAMLVSFPLLMIGISISLSGRYPKFSKTAFLVSAFLLISLIACVILLVGDFLPFTLILGITSAGLILAMIKLKPPLVHMVFSCFGIVFSIITTLLFINFM